MTEITSTYIKFLKIPQFQLAPTEDKVYNFMLEKNGQEIHVTVWASDIELIKNIGNVSSLIIFSHPSNHHVYV